MEKFEFSVEKELLPWIDFVSNTLNDIKPDYIPVRKALFEIYPYAVSTNLNLSRTLITRNKIRIGMKKSCNSKKQFVVKGSWVDDDPQVKFEAIIDTTGCTCTLSSIYKFYKATKVMAMTLKRVSANSDEPLRNGLQYKRQKTGAIGRAFFPSVIIGKNTEGKIIESGQVHDICVSVYTKKFGDPLKVVGSVSQECIDAITNSYAAVLFLAVAKKLNVSVFKENQILVSVEAGSYSVKMEGPSLGLAAAVAFHSLLIKKQPPNHMLFTGKITSRGEILEIGGTEVKLKVAQKNLMRLVLPKENFNIKLMVLTETIFCESLDELFAKIF